MIMGDESRPLQEQITFDAVARSLKDAQIGNTNKVFVTNIDETMVTSGSVSSTFNHYLYQLTRFL